MQDAAFKKLLEAQKGPKKMDHIKYEELKLQPYLKSELFTQKDIKMLALLRSQCVRGIRMNLKNMYQNSLVCPLNCNTVQEQDSQGHILTCYKLSGDSIRIQLASVIYFSKEITVQAEVAKVFGKLMKKTRTPFGASRLQYQPTRGFNPGP